MWQKKHKLRVLFHEKPFAGVNGSGKHCNWSLMSDKNVNLLSPGKTPRNNLQFLTFFINTIRAAQEHHYLLMASIASLNNSFRLGGSEAPPALMSVFIGETLTNVLQSLEERISEKAMTPDEKTELKLDIVGKIPEILPDNTDRNRTSTFAFTGNRFEFRAVGSMSNCAAPIIILNTAVAEQLSRFKTEVDALIESGIKKDEAIFQTLRNYIIESKPILFEGNGYSAEWQQEAAARGLKGITSVPAAFEAYLEKASIKMLDAFSVLNKRELEARFEIKNETFIKKLQIESRVLSDIATNHIIPTAIHYQNFLLKNIEGMKRIFSEEEYKAMTGTQMYALKKLSTHIAAINEKVYLMITERKKANNIENIPQRAHTYSKNVLPYLDDIRYHIDKLELIIEDELWPLPKYRELLFVH